jgi:hypothetical protein
MKFVHSLCLLAVVKLSQIMRLTVQNIRDINHVSLFIDGLKHLFAPLNIKGIMLGMQPRMPAQLYTELSVTVVQL